MNTTLIKVLRSEKTAAPVFSQFEFGGSANLELDDFGFAGEQIRQLFLEFLEVLGLGVGFEGFGVFVLFEESDRVFVLDVGCGPVVDHPGFLVGFFDEVICDFQRFIDLVGLDREGCVDYNPSTFEVQMDLSNIPWKEIIL